MHRNKQAYIEAYADRASDSTLVLDGKIDEREYDGIVFLMKEANQENMPEKQHCLSDMLLQDGFPWRLWCRVVEWIYAIEVSATGRIPRYKEVDEADTIGNLIRKVAVVNVNKAGGVGSPEQRTINARLLTALERHPELLRQQIEACNPRIIVCGGTRWCLEALYPDGLKGFDNYKGYCVTDLGEAKDVLILDMCHPGAHIQALFSFSAITAMCREAMEDGWRK